MKGGGRNGTATANTARVSLTTNKSSILFCRKNQARAKTVVAVAGERNSNRPSVEVGAIANRPGKFREEKQQPLSSFQADGFQDAGLQTIRKISTEALSNLEVGSIETEKVVSSCSCSCSSFLSFFCPSYFPSSLGLNAAHSRTLTHTHGHA